MSQRFALEAWFMNSDIFSVRRSLFSCFMATVFLQVPYTTLFSQLFNFFTDFLNLFLIFLFFFKLWPIFSSWGKSALRTFFYKLGPGKIIWSFKNGYFNIRVEGETNVGLFLVVEPFFHWPFQTLHMRPSCRVPSYLQKVPYRLTSDNKHSLHLQ